ncbi:MAG: Holliday junction branch migration protein RuvA [Chloroflexota bacterium]|nr:Holliday junction branch migration protein RuvA [Chloroflexota bacterium]
MASLQGTLEAMGSNSAIVNVGGIGFQVYLPTSALSLMTTVGQKVKLYTHFHLREDNATLYGFTTTEELALFETLLSVSGIGPKIALGMLSAMTVEKLTAAIATGSTDLLTEIPGIGKKTASRLILELKDKLGAGWVSTPATQFDAENADVVTALTSLGYSVSEASRAVAALSASSKLSLEEKIKLALQYFGGK